VVDTRASNVPDYTTTTTLARHSTGDWFETAALCPKVVEADPVTCNQCTDDCGLECAALCGDTTTELFKDTVAEKTCLSTCLLPYATCDVKIKVGYSATETHLLASEGVRYGYTGDSTTDTRLSCGKSVNFNSEQNFFMVQTPTMVPGTGVVRDFAGTPQAFMVQAGACHVCNEGDLRCGSNHGIPQVCHAGKWVRATGGKQYIMMDDNLKALLACAFLLALSSPAPFS
ncbi:hypothetical protein T484DRAFT_1772301, partial [Baffinella frigidus]